VLDQERDGFGLEYTRLAEAIPALVWVADEQGRTIYANRRWYDFTGMEIAGREPGFVSEVLVHPADRSRVDGAWREASDGSEAISVEYRLRVRDGNYRWIVAQAIPLLDERGKLRQWLGTAVDIHEQKTAAEYLRGMMEAAPQIVFTADPDGAVDYYNQRWYDLTGQSRDGASRMGWQSVIHPDDLRGLSEAWALCKMNGEPFTAEYRIRTASDGSYRWHVVSARPIREAGDEIVKWVGVATDIEDQKRREAAVRFLADASEMLTESFDVERRLEAVAERAVHEISDWCSLFLLRDGEFEPVAIAHRDRANVEFVQQLIARYPADSNSAPRRAMLAGRSFFLPIVPDEMLVAAAQDAVHLELIRKLDVRSSIHVPLAARGRVMGYINFVNGGARRIFDDEDVRFAEVLAKRIAVALDNARIYERERRVANTLQQAALPRALPEATGVSLSAIYHPAESEAEVGGDWYDAFKAGDRTLVLTMGDVSGKGLDAAVLMSVVRQAIRVTALESSDCSRAIAAADRALQLEYPGHIVSAMVLFIDLDSLTCRYVNAGHPPPLLRDRSGDVVELGEMNPPLGVVERRTDCIGYATLTKDAMLALYTDGLIESTHDVVEGDARLREALGVEAIVHTPNPARWLFDTVLDREPRDDVAILTVSFGRSRHWSFDARDATRAQGARAAFVRHLKDHGDGQSDFSAAEVIFGELTGNVVRYAPGPIDIDLEWTDDQPVLHVLDRGKSFSYASSLPDDPLSESGRGLFIVSSLGRDLRVMPLPRRGNHVSVRLPVHRAV
jgi:PAS domain S-box-containing protein